jgi:cobalamin synthase
MSRLAFHVSRRFAQSQRLLTLPRLLFSTGTAVLIPLALLGLHKAAIVWVTVVLVTVAAGYYGTAIIGGVVGDYLGATIQVSMSDVTSVMYHSTPAATWAGCPTTKLACRLACTRH